MSMELREAKVSCSRGLGPSKKAGALPLEKMHTLPSEWDGPLLRSGPAMPRSTLLVGAWWGMREIELAALRIKNITFSSDAAGCGSCSINLPVSKTDPEALGKHRLHGCCCAAGGCPVVAARCLVEHSMSVQGSLAA